MTILHEGVYVQRIETETAFALPVHAQMPIDAGDIVRTDEFGRVMLQSGTGSVMLILPLSEVRIEASEVVDGVHHVSVVVQQGEIVQHWASADYGQFTVRVGEMEASHQGGAWLLARQDLDRSYLIWHEGTGQLHAPEQLMLEDNTQIRLLNAQPLAVLHEAEITSPAKLDGWMDGCSAVVSTNDGSRLNSRSGPSTNFVKFGVFPNQAQVRVMGQNASDGWYRVQFLANFGWIQRYAVSQVDPSCQANIPLMADSSYDTPKRVLDITTEEQAHLQPFYGIPSDDPWYYQFSG